MVRPPFQIRDDEVLYILYFAVLYTSISLVIVTVQYDLRLIHFYSLLVRISRSVPSCVQATQSPSFDTHWSSTEPRHRHYNVSAFHQRQARSSFCRMQRVQHAGRQWGRAIDQGHICYNWIGQGPRFDIFHALLTHASNVSLTFFSIWRKRAGDVDDNSALNSAVCMVSAPPLPAPLFEDASSSSSTSPFVNPPAFSS